MISAANCCGSDNVIGCTKPGSNICNALPTTFQRQPLFLRLNRRTEYAISSKLFTSRVVLENMLADFHWPDARGAILRWLKSSVKISTAEQYRQWRA